MAEEKVKTDTAKTPKKEKAAPVRKRVRRRDTLRPMEFLFSQIYDISENSIYGYDTALQINDKKLGCLTFDRIMPVAEKSSLIHRVGKWQLEECCEVLKRTTERGKNPKRLFVTLSPMYLAKEGFLEKYQKILEASEVDFKHICIQLTEQSMMTQTAQIYDVIASLREAGTKVALTEFGGEASSLSKLGDLKVDYIKLDPLLMEGVAENQRAADIAESVVELAAKLGSLVICDGVDTREQLSVAKQMRCTLLQGNYFSVPEREDNAF